jgi:predicted enzyme related to lactoylglutathione lyase
MEPGRLQITFDCLDPARVGTFWAAALAYPAPDAEEIDAFAERLTALGARRLRAVTEDGYFVVMADPEGNEFCVD